MKAAPATQAQLLASGCGEGVGDEQLLPWEELKWTTINHNLSSQSSPPNCKHSTDSRVPKLLHHTDSAGAIVL